MHYYFFYDWKLQGVACISPRTPVNVFINGSPTASFTYTQNADETTFTNTSAGGTSWLWDFGDGDTSSAQNPVHTFSSPGTYTVTLIAYSAGCFNATTQTLIISAAGINTVDLDNALSIFPNPTAGLITISVKFNSVEQMQILVTNTLGQLIYAQEPVVTSSATFNLSFQDQARGIYFVQLKTKNGTAVRKLVLN